MMNEHGQQDQSQDNATVTASENGADQSRRRFTRASLIATPVIMTLASRPALGYYNCTISGLLSGNISSPRDIGPCDGQSPGFWQGGNFFTSSNNNNKKSALTTTKVYLGGWPTPATPDTLFHNIFAGSKFAGLTLIQVMGLTGTQDPDQLGFHTVAAYLNSLAAQQNMYGLTMDNWGLTPQQVIDLYNNNYNTSSAQLKALFEAWNHHYQNPGIVQSLLEP